MDDLPVTLFAPAKLTLSLRIVDRRPDGFHTIDAEMVSLDFGDSLEISEGSGVFLRGPQAGSMAGRAGSDDLVVKAMAKAGIDHRVVVTKNIPPGAGLGGGSSDAAAILRWAAILDPEVAVSLGADVVFCLRGGRSRVRGIGEVVSPGNYVKETYTLYTPNLHCSTPAVYRRWDEMGGPKDESEFPNDLTAAAIDLFPELAVAREALASDTGVTPRLAGSGSTWFVPGSFPGEGRVVATTTKAIG